MLTDERTPGWDGCPRPVGGRPGGGAGAGLVRGRPDGRHFRVGEDHLRDGMRRRSGPQGRSVRSPPVARVT